MSKALIELDGRVALVTGGSRGIGRAVALQLGRAGADVAINYHSNARAADEVVEAVKSHGSRAMAVHADVTSLKEAERMVGTVVDRWKRLDLVICNAGIWDGAPVEDLSESLWDSVIDTNLKGTWTVCRAAVPQMKLQKSGAIVIISSTAGQRGESGVSNYAASKGGQISFAKSLAVELAPFRIRVNVVAPGWVDTEMTASVFADEQFRKRVEQEIPLGTVATADDVALPVVFLCSEWAGHITGEVLSVNGGSILCG